jgi:REP element-mobilizing transposase RayT
MLAVRKTLWNHIRENAIKKGIHVDRINGHQDHCHCLISLRIDQTMSKVMQLLKGESSHWMNKTQLGKHKFEWQDDYYAVSVSETAIDNVRTYIDMQEEHHSKKSFQKEYDEILGQHGFKESKEG